MLKIEGRHLKVISQTKKCMLEIVNICNYSIQALKLLQFSDVYS